MDFKIPARTGDLRRRVGAFVDREPLPLEADPGADDPHGNIAEAALVRLRGRARAEGLWRLQLEPETGGSLDKVGMAVCYGETTPRSSGLWCSIRPRRTMAP